MNTTVKALIAVSALVALSGCVAVPVGDGYYEPAPVVYAPAPAYYGPPVYYGPSVSFGIYSGRSHGHRQSYRGNGHRGRGHR